MQTLALTDASTATLAYGTGQVANSSALADTTGDTFTVTALALDGTQTVTTYSGIDANGNVTTIAAGRLRRPRRPPARRRDYWTKAPTDLAGNRQFHPGVVHQCVRYVDGRRRRASGGHQLLHPDRRHAGQNDSGGHAELRADDQLRQRRVRARRRGHERASIRLQALQTQQQLGIQSLSIANQNSQLILKLFNG